MMVNFSKTIEHLQKQIEKAKEQRKYYSDNIKFEEEIMETYKENVIHYDWITKEYERAINTLKNINSEE